MSERASERAGESKERKREREGLNNNEQKSNKPFLIMENNCVLSLRTPPWLMHSDARPARSARKEGERERPIERQSQQHRGEEGTARLQHEIQVCQLEGYTLRSFPRSPPYYKAKNIDINTLTSIINRYKHENKKYKCVRVDTHAYSYFIPCAPLH